MTVGECERFLYDTYPKANQCPWDNTGLLCGDPEKKVTKILFALDVTDAVIDEAERVGAELIVAHHPVIRGGLDRVTPNSDSRIWKMCQKGIAAICMHTNLDISDGGVGDTLAQVFKLKNAEKVFEVEENPSLLFGRVGEIEPMEPEAFCRYTAQVLKTPFVRAVAGNKPIRRVAVMGGSGRDYIEAAARVADAYVTGDCRYHDFQLAERLGLTLIDAGHYPTENIIIPVLMEKMKAFDEVEQVLSSHQDVIKLYKE